MFEFGTSLGQRPPDMVAMAKNVLEPETSSKNACASCKSYMEKVARFREALVEAVVLFLSASLQTCNWPSANSYRTC